MLLTLDIGNSFVKYAFYDRNDLVSYNTVHAEEINSTLFEKHNFESAAISSVVPQTTDAISQLLQKEFGIKPYLVTNKSRFNIILNYKTPETLGIDRICACEGALNFSSKFIDDEKINRVVVDFGTATTINIVNAEKVFRGGIILPGIKTMINSLNNSTAQLPKITLDDYDSFFGLDTKSSIASGVLNSTISLIEKSLAMLEKESGQKSKLFVTGGNASTVRGFLSIENTYVEDLVLRGVKSAYNLNAEKD